MTTSPTTAKETHQEQLARLRAEVETLRDLLRRAHRLATVGTMTAMVAHEFNNILTPIISYAQLARTNPSLMKKAIARAADGGQRASTICKAILGLAAKNSPHVEKVNLAELVHETIQAMARDPRRDMIQVVLDVPPDLAITTRRVELEQVLLNLIINARAAVMARTSPRRIGISARCRRGKVTIQVRDNGTGIALEDMDRIFDPFFTTKPPRDENNDGNGLGLTICREIISAMKGCISAESTPGQGACFTIELPDQK